MAAAMTDPIQASGPGAPEAPALDVRDDAPTGVSRRTVLAGAGMVGLAGLAAPLLSTQVAYAASPSYTGDVVVVLSLRGGFDGLSALPPVGDPGYLAARPTIGIPAPLATPLSGVFGLHPGLAALKPLWSAGRLAALHAVGQPSPTRSHFEATGELERAAPGSTIRTGWLDRVLTVRGAAGPFQAVTVGGASLPLTLAGPAPATSMSSVDSFSLATWSGIAPQFQTALSTLYGDVDGPASTQAATTLGALSAATAMKNAGYAPANGAVYPTSALGNALRDVARLIKNPATPVQVVTVDYGNWDMHVDQGAPGNPAGWMHRQLLDLAACLVAFDKDLGTTMGRVSLVTLSEFGRRVVENGSGGADHGHGNVVFVLGGGVRGGQMYGAWPGLTPAVLDQGDLPMATDYRNVLGEILVKRCGITSLSGVFPGLAYAPLGVVTAR
jgi:uncharacterized protein (DUF1501 family)